MSAKNKAIIKVLEMELDTVRMLRVRSKDDAQLAIAAGERELQLEQEIGSVRGQDAA